METSIYLAKLIGPVMLAVGAGVFVNGGVFRRLADEFLRSRSLIFVSGLLIMSAGLAVVLAHNEWRPNWPVVITILGWIATFGGALRIVFPQGTETIGRAMLDSRFGLLLAGACWLALGALLTFYGYFR
jgi:predicted MFS family arabinose efflux permease